MTCRSGISYHLGSVLGVTGIYAYSPRKQVMLEGVFYNKKSVTGKRGVV
ncbi:MAG: hypothetical protein RLZZ324_526 [Candidatus Parcubacteria bacterium]|jgi:hypothetical protein